MSDEVLVRSICFSMVLTAKQLFPGKVNSALSVLSVHSIAGCLGKISFIGTEPSLI